MATSGLHKRQMFVHRTSAPVARLTLLHRYLQGPNFQAEEDEVGKAGMEGGEVEDLEEGELPAQQDGAMGQPLHRNPYLSSPYLSSPSFSSPSSNSPSSNSPSPNSPMVPKWSRQWWHPPSFRLHPLVQWT